MKNLSINIPFGNKYFPIFLKRAVKKTFVFEGYTFCVHKSTLVNQLNGYNYTVSEMGTGRKISTGQSKDVAIRNALKKLNKQLNKSKDYFHLAITFFPQVNAKNLIETTKNKTTK